LLDQRVISPRLAQSRHDEPEMAFSVFRQDLAHRRYGAGLSGHWVDVGRNDLDIILGMYRRFDFGVVLHGWLQCDFDLDDYLRGLGTLRG